MDIGKIYDEEVARHYDNDYFGLISGARGLGFQQIRRHVPRASIGDTLDLAVGTGEGLLSVREHFPDSRLHGIDLSEKMLEVSTGKLDFNAIHDDVARAGNHFAPASVDLILMNFLTTFVDGAKVVADAARLLKSGGYFSIVSSTYEAFPVLRDLCNRVVGKEVMDGMSPNPGAAAIAGFLDGAGLEVLAQETFEKDVTFASFPEVFEFGVHSGFFSHVVAQADAGNIAAFRSTAGFPLTDRYLAAAFLARKP